MPDFLLIVNKSHNHLIVNLVKQKEARTYYHAVREYLYKKTYTMGVKIIEGKVYWNGDLSSMAHYEKCNRDGTIGDAINKPTPIFETLPDGESIRYCGQFIP